MGNSDRQERIDELMARIIDAQDIDELDVIHTEIDSDLPGFLCRTLLQRRRLLRYKDELNKALSEEQRAALEAQIAADEKKYIDEMRKSPRPMRP